MNRFMNEYTGYPVTTESYMVRFLRENGTFIALLCIIAVFTILDPAFLTPRNLSNLTLQVTMIGIISIGMTVVILIGGIDLSVGSVVAMSAVGTTLLLRYGVPVYPAVAAGLVVFGGLTGLWNGFWVARFRIPAFIITLGMMTIGRGIALVMSEGSSVPVVDPLFPKLGGSYLSPVASVVVITFCFGVYVFNMYNDVRQKKKYGMYIHTDKITINLVSGVLALFFSLYVFGTYRGIPLPVLIFFVLAIAFHFILVDTRFGRRIYAMGGNEEAARLSGINSFRMT
ncbi:MAG: ABC transporter permease subunit, partial [Spirochaetota bacterium]